LLPSVIISDTSCLILLTKIGQLHLLAELFEQCLITPTVAAEFGEPLPDWLLVRTPQRTIPAELLTRQHDAGERSAIALALELPGSVLILDDAPARQLAHRLELPFTGTLGVLALAKTRGLLAQLRPIVQQLQLAGMWVAPELLERVCRAAGE
jgi:predicted nucleic acid-binding protein